MISKVLKNGAAKKLINNMNPNQSSNSGNYIPVNSVNFGSGMAGPRLIPQQQHQQQQPAHFLATPSTASNAAVMHHTTSGSIPIGRPRLMGPGLTMPPQHQQQVSAQLIQSGGSNFVQMPTSRIVLLSSSDSITASLPSVNFNLSSGGGGTNNTNIIRPVSSVAGLTTNLIEQQQRNSVPSSVMPMQFQPAGSTGGGVVVTTTNLPGNAQVMAQQPSSSSGQVFIYQQQPPHQYQQQPHQQQSMPPQQQHMGQIVTNTQFLPMPTPQHTFPIDSYAATHSSGGQMLIQQQSTAMSSTGPPPPHHQQQLQPTSHGQFMVNQPQFVQLPQSVATTGDPLLGQQPTRVAKTTRGQMSNQQPPPNAVVGQSSMVRPGQGGGGQVFIPNNQQQPSSMPIVGAMPSQQQPQHALMQQAFDSTSSGQLHSSNSSTDQQSIVTADSNRPKLQRVGSQPPVPPNAIAGQSARPSFSGSTASSARSRHLASPDSQARVVAGLKGLAAKYLPMLEQAIGKVNQDAKLAGCMRKYIKLHDILTKPEGNAKSVQESQLYMVEQLLIDISRDPLHLHGRGRSELVTSGRRAPSTRPPSNDSVDVARQQPQPRPLGPSSSRPPYPQQDWQTQIPEQRQQANRFRVPTTNLNTLLSAPVGPTSPPDQVGGAGGPFEGGGVAGYPPPGPQPHDGQQQRPTDASSDQMLRQPPPPHQPPPSFVKPTQTVNFYSRLQNFVDNFTQLYDKSRADPQFGRRVLWAMNEIAVETRKTRASLGMLSPSEFEEELLGSDPDTEGEDVSGTVSHQQVSSSDRSFTGGGGGGGGGQDKLDADPAVKPDQASSPVKPVFTDAVNSLLPSRDEEVVMHYEPPRTASHSTTSDALFIDVDVKPEQGMGVDDSEDNSINEQQQDDIDILTSFPSDQLDRINVKVRREIQLLGECHLRVTVNSNPPSITEMESEATCLDATEWNTSAHLLVEFVHPELAWVPCQLPPLAVRLPPDYVKTGRLNWHLPRQIDPTLVPEKSPAITDDDWPLYSKAERVKFADFLKRQMELKLGRQLRLTCSAVASNRRMTLYSLGQTWLDCISMSMAKFTNFDPVTLDDFCQSDGGSGWFVDW